MTTRTRDIDGWAADTLGSQREAAAGPLAAALRYDDVAIAENATVTLSAGAYEPLLTLAPVEDVREEMRVRVERLEPGPAGGLPDLRFAAWTERGAQLPALVPDVGPDSRTGAAWRVRLEVAVGGRPVAPRDVAALLRARVSEGRLAKLMHVLQAETPRLRRLGREVAAQSSVALARGFMLDRIGSELSVPRFREALAVRQGQIVQVPGEEGDADYRRRLGLFRTFAMPTRGYADRLLNGPPGGRGVVQAMGGPAGFDILEADNPYQIGFRIIAIGPTVQAAEDARRAYLRFLRETTLIDPADNVPPVRRMPAAHLAREQALRERLRRRLSFADGGGAPMAPYLARAFDRMARVLDHLEVDARTVVLRAQDDSGGSRHELGLMAEIARWPDRALSALRARLRRPPRRPAEDPDVAGVLSVLSRDGGAGAGDAAAVWEEFLRACGFRTVEHLTEATTLVSHVSMAHVQVEAASDIARDDAKAGIPVSVRLRRPGADTDVALSHALDGGADGWPEGLADWNVVREGQAALIDRLIVPDLPAAAALNEAGLSQPEPPGRRFRAALAQYPAHVVALLRLGDAFARGLIRGDDGATQQLLQVAEVLGANGAAALAVMAERADIMLVVSSIGLPQIGTNIGPRRASAFFWSVMPITGSPATIRGTGARARLTAARDGLYAVSVISYARIGLTDPFSWQVRLPPGAKLDLAQYEMVMNMLGRLHPLGVEINTWTLRRRHVALDGETVAPLPPRLSRSYRPFHRPRFAGTGDAPGRGGS
ncbi:hypothetical protein C882_1760 [Caenispirillum salinarum AK4]|uniref:Uncharacterized protein n=1 Tax=Caenispirillum salinarum AK4 TaxID=1238182 RepID=K9H9H0_9PROT|nr:hypothetical protein [Caenispirillum salinarum]EKV27258.1 hypothetical protein C882_1760 [Caenispirillum salinarum AK4]